MKANMLGGFLIGMLALAGAAMGATNTIAYDEAGNYTPATFVNGANLGTGFGAWDLWNNPATLGDSTAGGGGNLNSTNGYSFRFMSDGTTNAPNSWCNGKRNFDGALQNGDVLSFTFTYNWDGGGRGVDIFSASGQFANLIDVSPGNTFKVNGQTLSTDWSPGAVVNVEITQQADGIQMHLTRTTNGTENLNYTTNILNPEPATGFSLYCGGYTSSETDNPNYAIYMNDIQIVGEERRSLTFASGTWNPQAVGDYEFVLARVGAVGDDIVLTSSNPDAVTVPAGATFVSNSVAFDVTVVSLTNGPATLVASNEATGVWTDYTITPVAPQLSLAGPWELFALAPAEYAVNRIGAVGDDVVLSSSDAGVLTVPAATNFAAGATSVTFNALAVGYGAATIVASNAASGAWATFDVTVAAPALSLTGPATVWTGGAKYYALRRNSTAAVGASVNLTSSDTNRLTVPATVDFPVDATVVYFQATGVSTGTVTITADNDDVEPATFDATVADLPGVLAADHSGNYTSETFVNGANLGTGFGAWDFWSTPASLGDSTAGGGGDLNDTNGVAFRFMADGTNDYCNARRNFAEALKPGDTFSFTFTYNWVAGNRGVDIYSGDQEQFANLINVGEGNAFGVNGAVISTEYTPGAVVYVEIAQKADGIEVYLTRATNGVVNLAYTTNIAHGAGATSIAMYCGGYSDVPENIVNYAIFMNVLRIVGVVPTRLTFTGGTWNPETPGDYPFELTRSGEVTDEITLTSDNPAAVTVPAGAAFEPGIDVLAFTATVVSVTSGDAKIVASNAATGAWAEYNIYPVAPSLTIEGPFLVSGLGAVQYDLTRTGAVGDTIALSSSDTNVATVVSTAIFAADEDATTFLVTPVAYGSTTLYATDTVSGATADFNVEFELPATRHVDDIGYDSAARALVFGLPEGYTAATVYGADAVPNAQRYWDFQPLSNGVDYVVSGTNVTLTTTNALRMIIRIGMN
ncbi:MAG: hypothetical protein AB7V14_12060 [Kiritimatiellia bacterium]